MAAMLHRQPCSIPEATLCSLLQAGKLSQARQLLKTGCEFCPNSEDVWLEAARLQPPDMAKAVLAQGVAANPLSIALWLQVAASCASSSTRGHKASLLPMSCLVLIWQRQVAVLA